MLRNVATIKGPKQKVAIGNLQRRLCLLKMQPIVFGMQVNDWIGLLLRISQTQFVLMR